MASKIDISKARGNQVSVNYRNLLNIQNVTSQEPSKSNQRFSHTFSPGTHFVPSILLSNTMSLAPKIDKIAHCVISEDIDIAFFSETWLKDYVPDDPIKIKGYQIYRRDRKGKDHGGVCLYVKDSIQCHILSDFHYDDHEVLWANLRPHRLPRGLFNIIAGVLYHPPEANNLSKAEYVKSCLERIEAKHPNSGIILAGDFNKLKFTSAASYFQLKPMVSFPTRGANILDQIFTNLHEFYNDPSPRPHFGLSDHITVIVSAGARRNKEPLIRSIKARDKRPSNIACFGRFLLKVPWENMLAPYNSSEEKLAVLTDVVNYGINTIMPERSVKVHATDRP